MNFWEKHQGPLHIISLHAEPFRVVESQTTLTSRNLVDTAAEHDLLEIMLEASKPSVKTSKHYLLFTPFRYPPLKHGSRFGSRHERSLWYGSLELETALAEVAYYRLQFLQDTKANLGFVHVALTSFKVNLRTQKGINLCAPPFNVDEEALASKNDYTKSQALGSSMREAGIEAFLFRSARSLTTGQNIAVFTPNVFHTKQHQYIFNIGSWHCVANKKGVDFSNQDGNLLSFSSKDF